MDATTPFQRYVHLFSRLRHRNLRETTVYFLGRFHVVRRTWFLLNKILASLAVTPLGVATNRPSVEPFDVEAALRGLKSDSVFGFLRLGENVLSQLLLAARTARRFEAHGRQEEIDQAMLATHLRVGDPVLVADCKSPALQGLCNQVAHDPQLLSLACRFLGCPPRRIEIRIQESLVAQASVAFRESKNQTVQFHYDVQALNFLYVFFYLTDTNRTTGSHEMVRGTHRGKKLRHLLASARVDDDDIYASYGKERAWIIEGVAGQGFVEDKSCFHRALPPVRSKRLALQIRYS